MFGHGSPPKSASLDLQQAAEEAFHLFFGIVKRCFPKTATDAAVKAAIFRVWALAHGVAALALEKQVLFDVDPETLFGATRQATIELVASSLPAGKT